MKITARQLRTIIKEELEQLTEQGGPGGLTRYAVAVSVDEELGEIMEILAGSGGEQRVREVYSKLDSIPMNTRFTARDLMLDPAALTPQLQDQLAAIDMEKAGIFNGVTIISFPEAEDQPRALGMLIRMLMQFDADEDVGRGDRVTSGILNPLNFLSGESGTLNVKSDGMGD